MPGPGEKDVEPRAGEGREIIGCDPPSPAGGLVREEIEVLTDEELEVIGDFRYSNEFVGNMMRAKLRAYLQTVCDEEGRHA